MKSHRRLLTVHVGFSLLNVALLVIWSLLLAATIDRLFLGQQTLYDVREHVLAMVLVSVGRAGITFITERSAAEIAERVKLDLRARLTEHLLKLGPTYAQHERSGELATTLSHAPEDIAIIFSQYLPAMFMAVIAPVTILFFVIPIDLLSAAIMLITAPLIPFFMMLIGSVAGSLARKQYAVLSLMSAHFLDVLQGLSTLKLFNREFAQTETIQQVTERFRQATLRVVRVAFLSALALEMLATISIALIAVEIGIRLLEGYITFEAALFVLIIAPEFYAPLRTLGARFHSGTTGAAAAKRVFAVLNAPLPKVEADPPRILPTPNYHIRFEDVYFAYGEQADRSALNGLSFEIKPKQQVAVIGHSGAGKSTIAALLLRFIAPTQGQITVDGVPLHDLSITWWRDQIAWLPQKPYLFNATVAENICYAKPTATPSEMEAAALAAAAHEFILNLPQGYDTMLGERGARLSGGQAQRIALARAFLKDAPVLLLDEATANLDPETELSLQEAIQRLCRGKTTLMIAHRLTTVQNADHIVVLSGGRLIEQGTHQELLQRGGAYREMVMAYGLV